MRTLKKDVRKSLICIFSALFLLSMALFFCMTFLPARAESPFETNYELGETVRIPSRSIDAGGETVQANAVVILPDGSAVSKNSLVLEDYGTYTVEYRAMRDGRIYKEVYEFNVEIPFAESISVTDTVEYGAAAGYGPLVEPVRRYAAVGTHRRAPVRGHDAGSDGRGHDFRFRLAGHADMAR